MVVLRERILHAHELAVLLHRLETQKYKYRGSILDLLMHIEDRPITLLRHNSHEQATQTTSCRLKLSGSDVAQPARSDLTVDIAGDVSPLARTTAARCSRMRKRTELIRRAGDFHTTSTLAPQEQKTSAACTAQRGAARSDGRRRARRLHGLVALVLRGGVVGRVHWRAGRAMRLVHGAGQEHLAGVAWVHKSARASGMVN